jgi:hypothetical protein
MFCWLCEEANVGQDRSVVMPPWCPMQLSTQRKRSSCMQFASVMLLDPFWGGWPWAGIFEACLLWIADSALDKRAAFWRRAFWTTQSYCDRVQHLDACSLIMRKISRLGFRVYAKDDQSCRCKSWFQAVLLMRAVWSRCVICVFMSVSVRVSEWAHPCGVIEMLGVRISLFVMIWRCKGIVALAVWEHIYSGISSMRTHI